MTGRYLTVASWAVAVAVWSLERPAAAQDLFGGDAAKAAAAANTTATAKTAAEKKDDGAPLGQRREREVTIGEELSFREEQVKAEMAELEQRMFRLSEALKQLEPENSSRLVIGLKYARQELILHQMEEVKKALVALSLQGAVEEQKQLMVKLERLQQLLLSTDLDFEMKLERLRQIRETLRALDAVIKEESREEKISRKTTEEEKKLAAVAKRMATLDELIKRQTEHVETNAPLAARESLSEEDRQAVEKLGQAQQSTRQDTKALADELVDGAKSESLVAAGASMQAAVEALSKTAPGEAEAPMEKALAQLKEEREALARREAEAKAALAKEKFEAMRKDQQANRGATDQVGEMTRQLGANGTAALAELLRASGSMNGAENAFGNCQGGAGNGEQQKALAALQYAKELLAEEAERLARQLRAEVKQRVMEGLKLMLETQIAVRERTEALGSKAKEGSRQALAAVVALAKREEKITAAAQELINIVEETEFGIALPAALAAVRDATEGVQSLLAAGDASSEVVKAEKRIEEDLRAMLEIVSEMSDANSRRGRRANAASSPQEQQKELNRIISELRMLRLLETRVRENTGQVHNERDAATSLTAELRRRIEQLEGRQSDIQEATELLAAERGDELPQPE